MTHISATAFCVWSVMSCAMGAFLIGHLWRFDRFNCLRWSNSPYSGAFKRLMTYTYLLTVPLIMAYCFGFTYMKYKEGWIVLPGGGVAPKPYFLWPEAFQRAIFPLNMVFAFGWSFELITHLEELCFWLFLMNTGARQPDWFRSPFFRFWAAGSVVALVYVPLVTILYRENPLSCEARMFLAGSIGDLVLTLAFVPILITFPSFLMKVKAEGVDTSTMVRLRKFHELNVVRVIFRFLFCAPLFSLGVDGVKGHTHHLNESAFWTDLLIIITALGCAFSSICTLLIFFPRSYEAEYQAKEASIQRGPQSTRSVDGDNQSQSRSQSLSLSQQSSRLRSPVSVRLNVPKRRNTTSPARRSPGWLSVGKSANGPNGLGSGGGGGGGGVGASPQLPMQMPIEMEETTSARGIAPRPLPRTPHGGSAVPVRKDSGGTTFLLTDSPIEQGGNRDSLPFASSPAAGVDLVGSVNSAGLASGVDPFGASAAVVTANAIHHLPMRNHTHAHNQYRDQQQQTSIRAPSNVNAHPASYYEGDDKYNEFGYENAYDPDPDLWAANGKRSHDLNRDFDHDDELDADLDKDDADAKSMQEDTVSGLPRITYDGRPHPHPHPYARAAAGEQRRDGARSRAINFSRPMRGDGDAEASASSSSRRPRTRTRNALGLTVENVQQHNVNGSDINPIVHSFMSPLDVFEWRDSSRPTSHQRPRNTPRQSWV